MSDRPPHSDRASSVAQGLAAAWAAPSLTAALARGGRLLADTLHASASALFALTDQGIGEEAWYPEAGALQLEQRIRFQRAALEGPHVDPRHGASPGVLVTRGIVAVPGASPAEATRVTLAWVRTPSVSEPPNGEAFAEAVLEILAWRVAAVRESGRHRARQEQYERWFKTLDSQLRILDRERQKFAAVANQSDMFAFVTDASRTIRWLNKATTGLGGGGADWSGRSCRDLCTSLGLSVTGTGCGTCPVRRAFDENAPVHCEVPDAPGGRELYLTALPIKGPDGRPLEVLAQIQDLTNLEIVRRAKERLETVVAGAPIVLFAVDRDGVITLSEGRGLEALGLRHGEEVGQSVFERYRDIPGVGENIRRAMAGETLASEVRIGAIVFDAYYAPLRAADGGIQGVIGVATNVTERRRAEEALAQSEERLHRAQRMEAISSLAGGVAHDFNNLLTAMFGHIRFLRQRLPDQPEIASELDAIEQAADRAATLTRQLLASGRRQILSLRVVDLNAVIEGMRPMLRRLIREDIELDVRPRATVPWIRADAGQMEQVIINLAANARDAMPGGGRLTIATESREANVELTVHDTGHGMDEETQGRAFEPFFTTKPAGQGSGLGLSTVYGIVKQSGGDVGLVSAPGSGTTFTLSFPAAEPGPARSEDAAIAGGSENGAGEPASLARGTGTILLVEDEPTVRQLFRDVLEQAGYRVLEAASGVEALELVGGHPGPIDLMVTDVIMPAMGGGELVRRMARTRPEVKVLYVSGYTDDVLVRRGVLDSGVPFLQKPCMPDELARVVARIIR